MARVPQYAPELATSQWQSDYPNSGVMDGTQWQVEIVYPDQTVKAKGDNNFPEADGKPNLSPNWTPSFRKFVSALRTLLGKASCIPDDL